MLFAISNIAGITLGVIAALINVIAAGTLFLLQNSIGLLTPSLFAPARVITPRTPPLPKQKATPAIGKPSKVFTPRYQKTSLPSLSSKKTGHITKKHAKPSS
ncbi:MAG TPA: hypothetical protein PLD88_14770 [Candidatus Berkiella sp.]|nr:hypothetical protein [Candidatus Berkiella sp.]